jgi:hypothetical protein
MSPSTADANQSSGSESCHKQASDKKLTGNDKANFIKTCKARKVSRSGT